MIQEESFRCKGITERLLDFARIGDSERHSVDLHALVSELIAGATAAPWWAWGAGILGGLYIAASAAFGPMIGGATFLALIVAGQMVAALALDHYGLLGFPIRPLDAVRASGALLVVAGMFLLAK